MNRWKPPAGDHIRKVDAARVQIFPLDGHGITSCGGRQLQRSMPRIRAAQNNPPLIVDAETVPTNPIALQGLQAVARRNTKIVQPHCRVEGVELGPAAPCS